MNAAAGGGTENLIRPTGVCRESPPPQRPRSTRQLPRRMYFFLRTCFEQHNGGKSVWPKLFSCSLEVTVIRGAIGQGIHAALYALLYVLESKRTAGSSLGISSLTCFLTEASRSPDRRCVSMPSCRAFNGTTGISSRIFEYKDCSTI